LQACGWEWLEVKKFKNSAFPRKVSCEHIPFTMYPTPTPTKKQLYPDLGLGKRQTLKSENEYVS
jgi:hypothetical protein